MNINNSRLLAAILVLQVLILGSIWTGNSLPVAHAQIPDPGAQRERQLDELKSLNAKVDKLVDVLTSGKVQVQVARADNK